MGLPRAIIKKYGVTKKAWQVYRGISTSAKKNKTVRRVSTMARRYYKKSRRSGFGAGNLLSIKNLGATALGAMVAGPIGAAAGSYMIGKGGLIGAAAGYLLGNQLAGMTKNLLGEVRLNLGSSSSSGAFVN